MFAVQAYYNGHAFIPLEDKVFTLNQPAMIVVDDSPVSSQENPAIAAMRLLSATAKLNGTADMTLDEINEEIAIVRNQRKAKISK